CLYFLYVFLSDSGAMHSFEGISQLEQCQLSRGRVRDVFTFGFRKNSISYRFHTLRTQYHRSIRKGDEMPSPVKGQPHFTQLVFMQAAELPGLHNLHRRLTADARYTDDLFEISS